MKKRILFVEDNPMLLQMYPMMLAGEQDRWDVATAVDGPNALSVVAQSPFDVIVSDMRMPGMSGVELLGEVRRHHPQTSRIIISGIGDQEEVARSLGETHQFLAKPFDVKTLRATLSRISGLDVYLRDENLKTLVSQLGTLPSFPSLYLEIMKELDSPRSSIENVAEIIARDPGMTAKMLQIANSASVGTAHRINNPFEAIQQLGVNAVRSLAISAHVFSCFERTNLQQFSIHELWGHLMKAGTLARRIMQLEQAEAADAEDAYVAGMLHDMGKLMLANSVPEDFQRALILAGERHIALHEAEKEIFGATHAGVAAYLLGLWGLPAPIVEAVAFHHTPEKSALREFTPLTAVYAANSLARKQADEDSTMPADLDLEYLASVGAENRWNAWQAEAMRLAQPENG